MAVFKDRANSNGELLTASRALPHASANVRVLLGRLRRQAVGVIEFSTVRADRSIRPAELFDVLPGPFFVAKVLSQLDQVDLTVFHNRIIRLILGLSSA